MSLDLNEAQRVIQIEIDELNRLQKRLDSSFEKVVDQILATSGKVIFTGIGKSGQIAQKIASTFTSTGTPAHFVHPSESSHGDMGIISINDLVIAISYGGESNELHDIIAHTARCGVPLVALTGNLNSTLAKAATNTLSIAVQKEACPLNLAPTASTTVTLALGDALAMVLLKRRGFRDEDFAQYHPGGRLGRRLLMRVGHLMHTGDCLVLVSTNENMRDVIAKMTAADVRGIAGVINSEGQLIGAITDGDIRRRLEQRINPLEDRAEDIMSSEPKTIDKDDPAVRGLLVMEQYQVQSLFVLDQASNNPRAVIGVIHMQDLIQARLR